MLSKRERYIAIGAGLTVGILLLDPAFIAPLLESRERLSIQLKDLQAEHDKAELLQKESDIAQRRFQQYHAAGLATDPSVTEGQLLNAIRTWSQDARLPLSSIRPDRVSSSNGLHEITFQAGGDGTMRSLATFLYHLETSTLPVRVHQLQIASRTEGTDDLTVQLRISTLWDQGPPAAPSNNPAARPPDRSEP